MNFSTFYGSASLTEKSRVGDPWRNLSPPNWKKIVPLKHKNSISQNESPTQCSCYTIGNL